MALYKPAFRHTPVSMICCSDIALSSLFIQLTLLLINRMIQLQAVYRWTCKQRDKQWSTKHYMRTPLSQEWNKLVLALAIYDLAVTNNLYVNLLRHYVWYSVLFIDWRTIQLALIHLYLLDLILYLSIHFHYRWPLKSNSTRKCFFWLHQRQLYWCKFSSQNR